MKWKSIAVVTIIAAIAAALVIYFVLQRVNKTLDKAKSTADAAEGITSGIGQILDSGKAIWDQIRNG